MRQPSGPHITRASLRLMPKRPATIKARAEALEREAAQCLCLYPWPALAQSLLGDARRLRGLLRDEAERWAA